MTRTPVDLGHSPVSTTSAAKTITVTNVATSATQITGVALAGTNADQFALAAGGSCAGSTVNSDATCTVRVTFTPTTAGVKNATLRITPATGPAAGGQADRCR